MEALKTIPELLRSIENGPSNPNALNYTENNQWFAISTDQFVQNVKYIALALNHMGLKKGECVGILANPSPKWTIIDLAIMIAGGISVPLFANISDENFVFEVEQSELKILFITGQEQWNMYSRHREIFRTLITLEGNVTENNALRWNEMLEMGKSVDQKHSDTYTQLEKKINKDDIATIIYTSGSTGVPKGVELTHESLVAFINEEEFNWDPNNDRYLSVLPLAHVFGRSLNLFMIGWSVGVYYSNQLKNIGVACRQVHPTVTVVVPRILEKVYSSMVTSLQGASFLKKTIGLWAINLAQNEGNSLYKRMMKPIAEKLVYVHLREALGGKLRVVISGGAHLDPHLCNFFLEIGVPIYEGWGMTECSTGACNRPDGRKVGTVGKPLGQMVFKIAENGEILGKGPIIFKGYYKSPELTAQAFDKDGWLHTGDKGMIDADGFLTIIGRIKELYKTSTGEYIAPVPIEHAICKSPLIEMAMVVAEEKKYASVLLFPNYEVIEKMKEKSSYKNKSNEEFLQSTVIQTEIQQLLSEVNSHLNHWEKIHAYRFIMQPPTIETGELTPSMKIRREVVARKYHDLIDSIYQQETNNERTNCYN
jgi:long-chain acyl-CoA synthetase